MIVRKLVFGLAATVAVAAAAGVVVVAAAFAVYALLRDVLSPAGAAAAVAGLAALIAVLGALVLALLARPPRPKPEDASLTVRAMEFARAKPLIALGAAALAGVVLVRNPKIATTALTAFMAGKAAPKK